MAKPRSSSLWRTQNFLRSPGVIAPVMARSGIDHGELVLDIGAGTGTITRLLRLRGARVNAVEKDPSLCEHLRTTFGRDAGVHVSCDDFLRTPLPSVPYKVFASPPFDITSAIVSKLIDAPNPPVDAFLAVQREAAERCLGRPSETLYALLLKPWFSPAVVHEFHRDDFVPAPSVDVVMLRLRKRGPPLVPATQRRLYRDFVIACFTAWRPSIGSALELRLGRGPALRLLREAEIDGQAKPSRVSFAEWLELFLAFSKLPDAAGRVVGSERRLRTQQRRLQKRHRSRAPRDDLVSGRALATMRPGRGGHSLIDGTRSR